MNRASRRKQHQRDFRKFQRQAKYGTREVSVPETPTHPDGTMTILGFPPGMKEGQKGAWQNGDRVRLT